MDTELYLREDKVTDGGIHLTDTFIDNAKYQSVAGLVVGLGPDAYRDDKKFPLGPWCRVGDWILLPRYEATMLTYRGVAMGLIADDRVQCVITDPKDVQSITASGKF